MVLILATNSPHDIPPNVTALILGLLTFLGGIGLQRVAKYRTKRRPPKLVERVSKDDFDMFRDAYREEMDYVKQELRDVRQKLTNRTNQVKAISNAYRHLRDAFVEFVADANAAWKRGEQPPELTREQKTMLEDPLEDDPDVYDTITRNEFLTIKDNPPPPDDNRRRPRH